MLLFIQLIKKTAKQENQTIDQLAFCLVYLKLTSDFYMTKYILISVLFFPQYQCGFRKGYIAQHCLLAMTEKKKENRDSDKVCAAVLTDHSKAFDCLLHDLLIAKLHAFGFALKSLKVIHAYLNDRIQVVKVGSFYIGIFQIIYGVPQCSILRPLLFNVNLIDPFLAEHCKSDFSNYADDTTPYNCGGTFFETVSDLEITLDNLFNWLKVL